MFLKKLFGGLRVSWPVVVVFALVAGVYTGIVNQIPALANTSFADIAVTYECWVLFAAIVATNCEKPLEAALKTFVFFAISQPVFFLVELPTIGATLAWSYLKAWLVRILLTFPGGALAWRMKKGDWLSAAIVCLGAVFLGFLAANHALVTVNQFPRHLLSALFSLAVAFVFALAFIEKPALRALPCALAVVAAIGMFMASGQRELTYSEYLPDGDWSYELSVEDGSTVAIDDGLLTYTAQAGSAQDNVLTLTSADGETLVYDVSVDAGGNLVLALRD